MQTQTIEIKAADEASILVLLQSKGLLRAGENAWGTAPGVTLSIIGTVALQSDANSVPLAGYFVMLAVDPDIVPNGQAVWDDLVANHKWTGAPIRGLLGTGTFVADAVTRALNYAEQRKAAGGFRTPGTPINWYPFTYGNRGADMGDRMQLLADLPDDAAVAAEGIKVKRLNRAKEAITTKAQALAIATAERTAERRWDRAMDALEDAVLADPAYNWLTHTYPAGYQQ
jgi:hypothetical protein